MTIEYPAGGDYHQVGEFHQSGEEVDDMKLLAEENERLVKLNADSKEQIEALMATLAEYEHTLQLALHRVEDSSSAQCALLQDRVNLVNKSHHRLVTDYKTVTKSFTDLQTKYENLKLEANANASNIKTLGVENKDLRAKMVEVEDRYRSMKGVFEAKLTEMKGKTELAEHRAQALDEESQARIEAMTRLKGELQAAADGTEAARHEVTELKAEVQAARQAAMTAEANLQAELRRSDGTKQTVATLQKKVAEVQDAAQADQDRAKQVSAELAQFRQYKAQNDKLQADVAGLKTELNTIKARAFDATNELERLRAAKPHTSGDDGEWRAKVAQVLAQAEKYRAERDAAKAEVSAKEEERVGLVQLCSDMMERLESVREQEA